MSESDSQLVLNHGHRGRFSTIYLISTKLTSTTTTIKLCLDLNHLGKSILQDTPSAVEKSKKQEVEMLQKDIFEPRNSKQHSTFVVVSNKNEQLLVIKKTLNKIFLMKLKTQSQNLHKAAITLLLCKYYMGLCRLEHRRDFNIYIYFFTELTSYILHNKKQLC